MIFQFYWLKDHYFQCSEKGRMFYFDSDGKERELKGDEEFGCDKRTLIFDLLLSWKDVFSSIVQTSDEWFY